MPMTSPVAVFRLAFALKSVSESSSVTISFLGCVIPSGVLYIMFRQNSMCVVDRHFNIALRIGQGLDNDA